MESENFTYGNPFIPDNEDAPELCLSQEEVRDIILHDSDSIQYISKEQLEENWEALHELVKQDAFNLAYVPEYIQKKHPEICETAVKLGGHIAPHVDRCDLMCEMVYFFVKCRTPELNKLAVTLNGMNLQYIPPTEQTEELCTIAINQNPLSAAFVFLDEEAYERVVLMAISLKPSVFEDLPHQTPAISMAAVLADGMNLLFVKNETAEMRLVAIRQNPFLLEFIKNQTEGLCMEAIARDPFAFIHVDLEDDEAYERVYNTAVKMDPAVADYVLPPLRMDLDDEPDFEESVNEPTEEENPAPALKDIAYQTPAMCIMAILDDPASVCSVSDLIWRDAVYKCSTMWAKLVGSGHSGGKEEDVPLVMPILWKLCEMQEKDAVLEEVLDRLISWDPLFLRHVTRQKKRECMQAAQLDGNALEYVDYYCMTQEDYADVCNAAVEQKSEAIQFVHPAFRKSAYYFAICKKAVMHDGTTIRFVTDLRCTDYQYLAIEAVRQLGANLQLVDPRKCIKYGEVCLMAVRSDGSALKFMKDWSLLSLSQVCIVALRNNPDAHIYINENIWLKLKKYDPRLHDNITSLRRSGNAGFHGKEISGLMIELFQKIIEGLGKNRLEF